MFAVASTRAAAPATQPATRPATTFMRFVEESDGSARLEVADAAYRNPRGVVVHLIGAVHIADPIFYRGLNENFQHYDALLYEMVKSRGMGVPRPGQRSGNWIGTLQRFMKDRLDLTFQLDEIDYRAANFVHADMDWETFSQRQDETGESFFTLALRAALHDMARGAGGKSPSSQINGMELMAALMSPDQSRQLKLLLARQFGSADDILAGMEGPKGSVIISERNKAAFKVLRQQMDAGKKYIGIFYGAGHLKLMEQMLFDMGFKKVGVTWRTAWDIPPATATRPATGPATMPLRAGASARN
jgi:hypothetical protein